VKWIEKVFGRRQQDSAEIRFDELSGWLDLRFEKLSEELGAHANSLYPDIEHALLKIKKSTSQLEKAEPQGRFHLKMVKIGTSNRDNMVKQLRMLIDNIAVPRTADIKTILLFHENAMQSLTVCLENMLKSHQYAKQVYLEESKKVIADVNELGRLLGKLIEPVKSRKNELDAFENARNLVQTISNSDTETEKRTIREYEEKAIILKKELKEKQNFLMQLREGKVWKQYLDKRTELVLLENRLRQAESDINSLVLPLNKALNRLRQLSESGRHTLKPEVRAELYLCLSDPKSVKPGFFGEFRSILEGGSLNLTPEKKDKTVKKIGIVEASFNGYKNQYQSLLADIEKKKEEMSNMNVVHEEKNTEDSIKSLHEELTFAEKELEISRKHLVSLEQDVELKKHDLQQSISVIDNRVRILF
jgi:hypothetical protein